MRIVPLLNFILYSYIAEYKTFYRKLRGQPLVNFLSRETRLSGTSRDFIKKNIPATVLSDFQYYLAFIIYGNQQRNPEKFLFILIVKNRQTVFMMLRFKDIEGLPCDNLDHEFST